MRDDREDPADPPPSPTLGATAENDARVDARIARVLREGQDDDGLLAEAVSYTHLTLPTILLV